MRSVEEILERIRYESDRDILGLSIGDLISVLTFEEAESIRNEDATKEDWGKVSSKDCEDVKRQLIDYMSFALEKCVNHRGISASRSIGHMRNYVWLMEDDEALVFVEDDSNYQNYGAPMLKYLSDRYGFDYKSVLDETEIKMFLNMSKGLPCGLGNDCGCGR